MKLVYLFTLCFLFFTAGNTVAQKLERQVSSTTGANFLSPELTVDYTVGEVVVKPLKLTGSTLLTHGFQQPPNGVRIITALNEDMILYPNPTWEYASIKFNLDTLTQYVDVRVVNIMGQLAFTDKIIAPPPPGPDVPKELRPMFWALTYSFNTVKLLAGIYIVQIKTNTGFAVAKKFVKINK